MKKLLTLILPALALTTGAPMAAEGGKGYLGAIAIGDGSVKHQDDYGGEYVGTSDLFLIKGATKAEAKKAAKAKCGKIPIYEKRGWPEGPWCFFYGAPIGGESYNIDTHKPEKVSCAVAYTFRRNTWPGLTYQAIFGNKASALKRVTELCTRDGFTDCQVTQVICADDATPQQADAATPAPVEATADAPAQDPAGTADGASGERYGAFAIDEEAWAYGFSLLAPSRDRADQAALARCVQEGGDECEIKYVFNGSRCGAAAVAEEQGLRAWGYGHAESRGEAVATAMGFCERDNTSGGECRLVSVACGE